MPFDRWNDRIAAADDHESRTALVKEINYWRATRLTDVPAQRDAAFALARVYAAMGDNEAAQREARSLVSLCQSPPEASDEELRMATGFLQTLGGGKGVVARPARRERTDRGERPERAPRADRPEKPKKGRGDRLGDARAAAVDRRWKDALRALEGHEDAAAELVRTYVVLARAIEQTDEFRRVRDLLELERHLKGAIAPRAPREEAAPAAQEAAAPKPAKERPAKAPRPADADHPLASILGQPVPGERQERIDAIEAASTRGGVDLDALATEALDHHLVHEGPKAPAPWLIGVAARAYAAGDALRTKATVAKLAEQGAYAVTAYEEPPFAAMVELIRGAEARGTTFAGLRRGVLSRGEPRDRKLWTLRLDHDGERMVVVGGPSDEPYRDETADRLAHRIVELCPRAVLVAPGPGNANLRERSEALGIKTFEEAPPDEILDALLAAEAVEAPTTEAAAPASERPERAEREPRGRAREAESADALKAALTGDEPSVDALVPLLEALPRVHRAFGVAREALHGLDPDAAERRLFHLLEAADRAAPEHAKLSEGTTIALEAAARQGRGSPFVRLLTQGSTAQRYGGPGVEAVLELAEAVVNAGWTIDRVLRGPTARERRQDAVLEALGDGAEGMWRLLVKRDGVEGELWYVADLPPEGRAALPRLLLEGGRRVVVLPVESDLLQWYGTIGGPEAIGWTGSDSANDVLAELDRWAA